MRGAPALGIGEVEDDALSPQPKRPLAVCAIMKNEAAHVLEWVAFYRVLGVERFHLYDNASTDDTVARLAPLVRAGLVEVTPWPQRPGQVAAYEDFARRSAGDVGWTAFIDLDEFIHPFAFDRLPAWLDGFDDGVAAVALRWLNFGPSGHETRPEGLTLEQYRTRLRDEDPVHGHVKTIVRMDRYRSCLGAHAFAVDGAVVDERGRPVTFADGTYAVQEPATPEQVCLNHYYTRSRREWEEKVARGRADHSDEPAAQRRLAWFDTYAAHATVKDERILRFADRTRAQLEAFAALPR